MLCAWLREKGAMDHENRSCRRREEGFDTRHKLPITPMWGMWEELSRKAWTKGVSSNYATSIELWLPEWASLRSYDDVRTVQKVASSAKATSFNRVPTWSVGEVVTLFSRSFSFAQNIKREARVMVEDTNLMYRLCQWLQSPSRNKGMLYFWDH